MDLEELRKILGKKVLERLAYDMPPLPKVARPYAGTAPSYHYFPNTPWALTEADCTFLRVQGIKAE